MVDCLFCKIIKKEIPADIIYEDKKVLAFNDIAPQAPTHILVIPKEHAKNLHELSDLSILPALFETIRNISKQKGIDQTGFRVVLNNGREAGQAVDHLHFHLLGGRPLSWPPG